MASTLPAKSFIMYPGTNGTIPTDFTRLTDYWIIGLPRFR